MKIEEIKELLKYTEESVLRDRLQEFREDERPGVQKLILQYEKKAEKYGKELERIENMRSYERKYSRAEYICGIDEVGRGPLAGPVVTCAVILPKDCRILYVNDSKKLSEKKREELYQIIMEQALDVSIGIESRSHRRNKYFTGYLQCNAKISGGFKAQAGYHTGGRGYHSGH